MTTAEHPPWRGELSRYAASTADQRARAEHLRLGIGHQRHGLGPPPHGDHTDG
ncbi:MAG: hypothetical protein QOI86_1617 [Actinomycetota bacterium]|nr:hypothetical protein [Actinomycetota bacterium]